MAVLATDLKFFLTADNLGGAITATQASAGNVFDAFNGDETSAGTTVYACLYAKNNAAQTAFAARVYINAETTHAGANVQIGLGSSAIDGEEQTIDDENTAPASVTFVEADGEANALSIGDLTAGQTKAIWLKFLIAPATAAKDAYTVQLGFRADTAE